MADHENTQRQFANELTVPLAFYGDTIHGITLMSAGIVLPHFRQAYIDGDNKTDKPCWKHSVYPTDNL